MRPLSAGKLRSALIALMLVAVPVPHAIAQDVFTTLGNSTSNLRQTARDAYLSTWSLFSQPLSGASVDAVTPPSPAQVLRSVERGPEGNAFWEELSDVGYEITEIDTSVGLLPEVKMSFQLVRELSEADRDALDRRLEVGAARDPGVLPGIQRGIIQTLLAASDLTDMQVTKLVVSVLPLPSAQFKMEPRNATLTPEHDALFRAITNKSINRPPLHDAGVPLPPPAAIK